MVVVIDTERERVAATYMLRGLQHWGQSDEERDAAIKAYVEAAGFKHGSEEAKEWLQNVNRNLRRGDVNDEIRQLQAALDARAALGSPVVSLPRNEADLVRDSASQQGFGSLGMHSIFGTVTAPSIRKR